MSFKKKIGLGIMTGALGVSLIGGGTWAAFNDVEELDNSLAAGTLDLVVNDGASALFELENLKPGDNWTKTLRLNNNGSLDFGGIKITTSSTHVDGEVPEGGANSKDEFLSQFKMTLSGDLGNHTFTLDQIDSVVGQTLPSSQLIPEGDLTVNIHIEFVDDTEKDGNGEYIQNKYQGDSADLDIIFEAIQKPGEDRSNG